MTTVRSASGTHVSAFATHTGRMTVNTKAASRIQPTIKKSARSASAIGKHKNAYSLYSGPGRKPRNSKVTVTVDIERVATAFATRIDRNHNVPFTGQATYQPVILPYSKSITR